MRIILVEPVKGLGRVGDVVEVAAGYARNFLLPKQKAMRATKENLLKLEERRAELEKENQAKKVEAEKVAESLKDVVVKLIRQAAEDSRLYGSVTARDIVKAIHDSHGVELSPDSVVMTHKFKTLGAYDIQLFLHPEVSCKIELVVSRNEESSDSVATKQ